MRTLLKILGGLAALAAIVVAAVAVIYFATRVPIPAVTPAADAETSRVAPGIPLETVVAARARLTQLRAEAGFPSVSIAVAAGGRIVWLEAEGLADLEPPAPATVATRYAIGSVSKSLTAAVVMRLAERGLLDLDSDVRAVVPAFAAQPHALTLRQLLSHQAGVRHYRFSMTPPVFSDMGSNRRFASATESLAMFADDPLLFAPDSAFSYSTYGYTLASAAIEAVLGQTFPAVMQQELFTPLGLAATGVDDRHAADAARASDYSDGEAGYVLPAPEVDVSNKWAGGGFRSTPEDLARFGAALIDGQVVRDDTLGTMLTPRTLASGEVNEQRYGLGFRRGELRDPRQPSPRSFVIAHHGGVAIGCRAMLLLLPDERVVVALAGNATGSQGNLLGAATDIALLFVDLAPDAGRDVPSASEP